ncbi:zinc finger protein with KRAB and SCAN domains 8-like [Sinocyclocheilus grahami]|uniref:Zinc finger protein with KRAB and SCAN domains 8-like n=1 Tax=Sinocyclocheilus grahami TaxID=75366 RepID=A0A672RSK3_SINGR|nr:PREDICTED: zinc finger protein with KRAB and SCAN domains 8-like [Sinocyclocheilus grahami]
MEVNVGASNPAVIADVSFSFQDELTATLQNALGVAVEIAVAEITRLLDRALRDVRGKIQEALRDNSALKFRLQTAETQLSNVCGRLNQQPQILEDFNVSSQMVTTPISCSRVQRGGPQLNTLNNVRQQTESAVDSENVYEVCGPKETDVFQRGSVCGNPHGGACAQASNSLEESTPYRLDEANDIKNEQHSMTKTEQGCAGMVTDVLSEESSLEVAVKVEKEDGYGEPIPVTLSVVGEPNSNRIFLAQSQLLEDWRPEPLQSESCQTNMHCQSNNQSQDFLSSSSSGQQSYFPKFHNNYKGPECHAFPPGRRLYRCGLCERDFNRKQHLKIHQRIHTGERPYTCSICSARFRHALTLKRHSRIHTGEKPYACDQCGKNFRNDGGLKFHQCS